MKSHIQQRKRGYEYMKDLNNVGYFDILGHPMLLSIELDKNVYANATKLYTQAPAQ